MMQENSGTERSSSQSVQSAQGGQTSQSAQATSSALNAQGVSNVQGTSDMQGAQGARAQSVSRSCSKISNGLWAAAGFFFFALGAVGVVLPILPTTPFILLAAFCFARSSQKINDWFKQTKLYEQVLEGYVTKRAMTLKAKLSILVPVTILLSIGFALMSNVPVGRAILVIVWVAHVVYFGFVVKTEVPEANKQAEGQ